MTLTKLSEELSQFFADEDDMRERVKPLITSSRRSTEEQCPGFDFHHRVGGEKVLVLIRSMERFFAGKEFQTGQQAVDETCSYLNGRAFNLMIRCTGRGIICGDISERLLEMTFRERNNFLETDEFTELDHQQWLAITEDAEAAEVITSRFSEMFTNFVCNVGLTETTGRETRQIFMVWKNILHASSAGFYVVGTELGKARANRRQFNDIVANSMSDS